MRTTASIAGQLSSDLDGQVIQVGAIEARERQVWGNLEVAIRAPGGSLKNIMPPSKYAAGIANLAKFGVAPLEPTPDERCLTSATTVVPGLASYGLFLEVTIVAVIGKHLIVSPGFTGVRRHWDSGSFFAALCAPP